MITYDVIYSQSLTPIEGGPDLALVVTETAQPNTAGHRVRRFSANGWDAKGRRKTGDMATELLVQGRFLRENGRRVLVQYPMF